MKTKTARKPKSPLSRFIPPQLVTVPKDDPVQERHPVAGSRVCGATRNLQGTVHVCELKPGHGDRHYGGGRSWRPASGDLS
jgi:hypothetical protein